ncbi:MAG: hypothetical protein NZO16_05275 [Deltaproteobacteria bacterium]|nr:hypothetical protein [Deltaproteobacteria bacterium]
MKKRYKGKFYLTRENLLVETFLKIVFPEVTIEHADQTTDFSNHILVLTEVYNFKPPNRVGAILDCHIGSRLLANHELNVWLNEVSCPKYCFYSGKNNYQYRNLLGFNFSSLHTRTNNQELFTQELGSEVTVVLGPWEIDYEFASFLDELNELINFVAFGKSNWIPCQKSLRKINSLEELYWTITNSKTIVNLAFENYFPLIELWAYKLGKQTITSCYGCQFEYLGESSIYFQPFNKSSFSTCLKAAGVQISKKIIFEKGLERIMLNDFGFEDMTEDEIIAKVEALTDQGDFETAKQVVHEGLVEHKTSAKLRRAQGLLLLSQNFISEAKPWLLESNLLDPDNPKTMCALGIVYAAEGMYQLAEELLTKSYYKSDQPLIPLFKLIEIAYKGELYRKAIECLTDYLTKTNFNNSDLTFTLAGLLYRARMYDDAIRILEKLMKSDPNYESAVTLKSLIQDALAISKQNATNDLQEFNGQEENSATSIEIHEEPTLEVEQISEALKAIEHAEGLKRNGNFEEAFNILSGAYHPNLPPTTMEKMQFLMLELKVLMGELNFFEANREYFETNFENHPRWLSIKGTVSLVNGNIPEGENLFKKALQIDPHLDLPWAGLGLIAEFTEDWVNAKANYEKALDINPLNIRAIIGLCEVAQKLNEIRSVEARVREFLARDPENVEVKQVFERYFGSSAASAMS